MVDTQPFPFLKCSGHYRNRTMFPSSLLKLFSLWSFGSALMSALDNSPKMDCSVLLYPVFVGQLKLLWTCYVKIKQIASKEVEVINLVSYSFCACLGFFVRIPLNAMSPLSSCIPYAQLSPASHMLSYSLRSHTTILAQLFVPLYSLVTSEARNNTMLWTEVTNMLISQQQPQHDCLLCATISSLVGLLIRLSMDSRCFPNFMMKSSSNQQHFSKQTELFACLFHFLPTLFGQILTLFV